MTGGDDDERAAFRAFVRTHHPDRGGDSEAFVAGLARFRPAPTPAPPSHPAPSRDDGDRFDAPVEVVMPLPVPVRVAVALIRTIRRQKRHRRVL